MVIFSLVSSPQTASATEENVQADGRSIGHDLRAGMGLYWNGRLIRRAGAERRSSHLNALQRVSTLERMRLCVICLTSPRIAYLCHACTWCAVLSVRSWQLIIHRTSLWMSSLLYCG